MLVKRSNNFINSINIKKYSKLVEEHFANPKNVGKLDEKENNVGTAIVGKAACGDVIKFQIKVKDSKIEDVKYKVFGCGSAIASSSYASDYIKGMTLDEALNVSNTTIADDLKLPPVKLHCSLLAEEAIKLAIEDFKKRNQATNQKSEAV